MRGELRAVITTDALELGIDVGELDAAVVVTFPGTVASLRQMWGRAGPPPSAAWRCTSPARTRSTSSSAATPRSSCERPVEAAILDHESPLIFAAHLRCAAHEGPLDAQDAEFLGPRWEAYARAARERRRAARARRRRARRGRAADAGAHELGPRSYVPRRADRYPAAEVSLRSASPDSFVIVDVSSGELLGQTEAARAHSTVHDGAIYLHQGRSYEVRELDLAHRRALVAPFDGDWYTQPKRETDTTIERLLDRREALGVTLSFGEVSVTETVLAYQRKLLSDHSAVDLVALDLPQTSFATQALWFELDADELAPGDRGWRRCSARCTRQSTPRSPCCR